MNFTTLRGRIIAFNYSSIYLFTPRVQRRDSKENAELGVELLDAIIAKRGP